MSEPKWTPGPWAVETRDKETWVVAYCGDDDPWFVCNPELYIGPGKTDRAPANAHLIAAAPDLYEAMDGLHSWFGEEGDGRDISALLIAARAALAKARGEA